MAAASGAVIGVAIGAAVGAAIGTATPAAAAAAPTAEDGGGAVDSCAFAEGSGGGPPIPRGGWLELADCANADCMPIAKAAGAGGGAIGVGSSP